MINFDLQAIGWKDDGSESGVIKTQKNTLILIPFENDPQDESAGVNTNALYYGLSGNEYSNGSSLTMILNTGIQNYIRRTFAFKGTSLGIFREAGVVEYSVVIDGVVYKAGGSEVTPIRWDNGNVLGEQSYFELITEELTDDEHVCEIIIQGNSSGTTALKVYGIAVIKESGYEKPYPSVWRLGHALAKSTATTFATMFSQSIRGVQSIIMYNSHTEAVKVTMSYAGGINMYSKTIQAGESVEIVFNPMFAIDKNLYSLLATANDVVTVTLIGR